MLSIPKSVCFIVVIGMRWKGSVRLRVLHRGIWWHRGGGNYMGDLNIPPIWRDERRRNSIMADVCSCCGKKIPFLDVDFDYIEIDKESYRICSKCRSKISAYNSGDISVDEVISDATHKKVADYLRNIKSDEEIEYEKKEKERIENKIVAQKNDPLYDDIHQIAGDLRFIKNLIIVGLVCGFILGLIGVLGLI